MPSTSSTVVTSNPFGETGSRLFMVRYILEVPIYILGLNSYVIYRFLRNKHKRFHESRMNRIITLLLFACLSWSVVSNARYFVWLFQGSTNIVHNTIFAFLSPVCLISILGTNLMLAMERFFVMQQKKDQDTKPFFLVVLGIVGLYVVVMLWIFSTSTSDDSVLPDSPLQAKIWIWSTALFYIATIISIISLYVVTYHHTRKVLRKYMQMNSGSYESSLLQKEAVLQIEKKVLLYSICFGCVVIACYLPELLMNGVIVMKLIDPYTQQDVLEVWKCVANVFLACDVVLTPLLVLFVGPKEVNDDDVEL
ncbi:hypothetical protein BCR33DRAFT_837489 [Rhizoclosmatium globosum]|uniref:G-protein coupled receptors family 1 profile domain-containing protein n=1 Tax=Rhizoclosmatium globosum TaxID=329046 RepID=A0A1Y2BKB1_9FUNG|nr:hypothetical protein BCR33DRAFT_837489 [Rhizoclosmatium globosum]|eukprot:ORY35204.1 hypothetical protein BCR33DRAFT_837489 [Rhizoclosmatium globosum]